MPRRLRAGLDQRPPRGDGSKMLALLIFVLTALAAPSADWEQAVDGALPGIVAIRVTTTRAFDTELPRSSVATGFVVDAERGLLLTNRHVVSPAPVVAEAVFADHEEVPLTPVYRDPVHDFGIFHYDPSAVKFMKPVALELYPQGARVGAEIRVVGNDAGEKISILGGTLARLDRDAPNYAVGSYNDFDTFYYQAASGTSGGSSGSPVLDDHGRVIALNAGARRDSASSFFLPLDRVVRALALVQAGQEVSRGTLQAIFKFRTFDEVRRLGLRPETEARFRSAFAGSTGMLTVEQTVPNGPAWTQLEPGDVLTAVNGAAIATFVPLDEALDSHVGQQVTVEVERGGQPLSFTLPVQDLHSISPAEFLEFSAGVVHALSYQQARSYGVPAGSVYVATPGYALANASLGRGTIIEAVGGAVTPDLDAFERALEALPQGAKVPVRYTSTSNPKLHGVTVLEVDRLWFPMQRCARDDARGEWPCRPSAAPPSPAPAAPATFALPPTGDRVARRLAASFVGVTFTAPFPAEGLYSTRFTGTGLVVDAARGLVVVDRDTAPLALGDAAVIVGGTTEIPARVIYLHPVHNLAVIQYDPAALAGDLLKSAELRDGRALEEGDRLWQVGLDSRQRLVSKKTTVSRVQPLSLPLPSPPFFRDANLEVIVPGEAAASLGGALVDRRGRVLGLWASFPDLSTKDHRGTFYGVSADQLSQIVDPLRAGVQPVWRTLGAELGTISLSSAADMGLPGDAVEALRSHAPREPQAMVVNRVTPGTPGGALLREGDVIVEVNHQTATRYRELELASQADTVSLRLMRMGALMELEVPTEARGSDGEDRVLLWAGAILHAVPESARSQRQIEPAGVYVAYTWNGSPASRFGLSPTSRIMAVDGAPTLTLEAFEAALLGRPNGSAVRLRLENLDGEIEVVTLKLDLASWPTSALQRGADGWSRAQLDPAGGAAEAATR